MHGNKDYGQFRQHSSKEICGSFVKSFTFSYDKRFKQNIWRARQTRFIEVENSSCWMYDMNCVRN